MTKPKSIPQPTTITTKAFTGPPPGYPLAGELESTVTNVLGDTIVLAKDETLVTASLDIVAQTDTEFEVIAGNRFYFLPKADVVKTKNARVHRSGTFYLRSGFQARLCTEL